MDYMPEELDVGISENDSEIQKYIPDVAISLHLDSGGGGQPKYA